MNGIRIVKLVYKLSVCVQRVVHYGYCAYFHNPIKRHGTGNHVGQKNGYPVPLFNAFVPEKRGKPIGHVIEFLEADPISLEDKGYVMGNLLAVSLKILMEETGLKFNGFWYSLIVKPEPGFIPILQILFHGFLL
jgi:hypothetical protein